MPSKFGLYMVLTGTLRDSSLIKDELAKVLYMTDNDPVKSKDDLGLRLAKARQASQPPKKKGGIADPTSGFGAAMRIGTEMVASLVVGVAIGYGLDDWLGTGPWLMIAFFFLGSAAGIMNVYKSAGRVGASPIKKGVSDETGGTE